MQKRKKLSKLILTFICLFTSVIVLAGCGGGQKQAAPKADDKFSIKIGYAYDEKLPMHLGAVKFAEMVAQRTNGNVQIKLFPNSTLGTPRDLTEGLQLGTIDMALVPTTSVSPYYNPIDVFYLPFIFQNKEHAYKVADGPIGQKLYDGLLKEKGIRTLAMYESGFRAITNSKRPIRKPEDLAGIKMRVADSPILISTFRNLGANCTPMALAELYTGLQQGTVDGQDNPIGNVYAFRYYEVQKYLTFSRHQWAGVMMIISEKTWKKLPAEYQKIITVAAKESESWERIEINAKEKEYLETIKKAGVQIIDLTPEETAVFQNKMKPLWTEFEEKGNKELVNAVSNAK